MVRVRVEILSIFDFLLRKSVEKLISCVTAFDREETEDDLNHFQSFLAEFYWAVWGKRPASKYHFYEMVINFKLKYILVCRCDGCDGLMVT